MVAALTVSVLFGSNVARADDAPKKRRSSSDGNVIVTVDEPAYPGLDIGDAIRIWLESFHAPGAEIGDAEVDLSRPEVRLRARLPVDERVSMQLTGTFGANLYDVDGEAGLFRDCAQCRLPDVLYSTSLGLQAGFLINESSYLLRPREQWAVLTAGFVRARWEPGAFSDSISGGGSLGLGYKLPEKLRIALGARVETSIEDGKLGVGPMGDLRWDITDRWRLRNRGVGLQLDYRPGRQLEFFVAGFRTSDRFQLDRREGDPSDLSVRDRQILAGAGIEWKLFDRLRITTEAGAIVTRKLTVSDENDDLDTAVGSGSPYFELRVEVRP